MKPENLFLLAIVGIGAWWLFRDAAKQNELQQRALLQQQAIQRGF